MYNLGGGPRFAYVSSSSRHQNNKLRETRERYVTLFFCENISNFNEKPRRGLGRINNLNQQGYFSFVPYFSFVLH